MLQQRFQRTRRWKQIGANAMDLSVHVCEPTCEELGPSGTREQIEV